MNTKIVVILFCMCIIVQYNGTDAFLYKFLTSGKLNVHRQKPDAKNKIALENANKVHTFGKLGVNRPKQNTKELLVDQNRRFKIALDNSREEQMTMKQLAWKVFMLEARNDIKPLFIG